MKKLYLILLLFPLLVFGAEPTNYYNAAVGYTEAALKTKLFTIVGSHTKRTYANLWTDFQTTDKRADGKVWDMYSTCTFTFVTNQDRGSHTPECTAYNREHSFPKSWFKVASGQEDSEPMGTDLFHLYPTDGYVNEKRGNLPFGEVGTSTYNSVNNFSKSGSSSFSGYSGTVFEPANEYKGDFARSYFYMVTAYESVVNTWNTSNTNASPHLDGTKYPALNAWSVNLFLKWNAQDPVSTKETNRNNAVYGIQKNRNPFIDHPELAEYIWGNKKGTPWSLTAGIDELKVEFTLSPNPAKDVLNISTDEPSISCSVFNLNGQLLLQQTLNNSEVLSVATLNNGMYLLQVQSGSRKTIQKFIINK